MTLSIVIVHYNTPVELIKCLRSVTQYLGDINFEVIVVDNCSVDRTIENFKIEFPWVGFYFMKENLGYAKANNFAVNKSTGDFILLLNPDTELIEDCISPMLKFLEDNPAAGACGPMLVYKDGRFQNSCGGRMGIFYEIAEALMFINLYRRIWRMNKINLKNNLHPVKVGWLSGACILVNRKLYEEVGGFSNKYFLNYEDIDLCARIEEKFFLNYYFPNLRCIHLDQTSQKKNYEGLVFTRYQSRLIYAKFHYNTVLSVFVRLIHIVGILLRLALVNFIYRNSERSERYAGYKRAFKLYTGLKRI